MSETKEEDTKCVMARFTAEELAAMRAETFAQTDAGAVAIICRKHLAEGRG